jgi:LysM repeat protein
VTFLEHVVRRGETLSGIAGRYRVGVSLLRAANPRVHPLRLKVGARLTVPISSAARRSPTRVAVRPRPAAVPAGSSSGAALAAGAEHHVVARGETLWMISQRYGVRVADLRVWNGIELGGIILVGQRLRVAPPPTDTESR